MFLAAFAIPLALMLTLGWVGPDSNKLVSKHPNTAWAGDKNLVDDKFDPKASFSTLYALSSATGKIPRWTDHPEIETGGIWVSEQPPPPGDWRWLSPFLSVKHTTTDPRNPWDKLVRFVNSEARYTTSAGVADPKKCDAGGLWTNEGLGSWWFGMGTAPARIEKISSGLDWLNSGKTSWGEPPYAQVRGLPEPCTVMTDGGKRLELELPRANAEVGSYVYLGAGVSALVTKLDGKIVLTGARDKDCFGYANSMKQSSWVLIYKDDLSAPKR
jgi:hypothetical protein